MHNYVLHTHTHARTHARTHAHTHTHTHTLVNTKHIFAVSPKWHRNIFLILYKLLFTASSLISLTTALVSAMYAFDVHMN